jgi:hypothetical protein
MVLHDHPKGQLFGMIVRRVFRVVVQNVLATLCVIDILDSLENLDWRVPRPRSNVQHHRFHNFDLVTLVVVERSRIWLCARHRRVGQDVASFAVRFRGSGQICSF